MVRNIQRSQNSGSRGGHKSSQPAQAANQLSPPTSQATTPPSSPPHRPYPYHAFQNYHFKFQNSLNRPIISANISIIFTEEESPPLVSAHNVAKSSQRGFIIAGTHGMERQQNEGDQAKTQSDWQAADKDKGEPLSPSGIPHGALATFVAKGNTNSTAQDSTPPSGSGASDAAKEENVWYGNECPVVEEPLDQDAIM